MSRPAISKDAGKQIAPTKPIDQLRNQLARMEPEFKTGLPAHIPVERFQRVVMTAANQNQDLLFADRKSLMGACMRSAQDGLLPDGREGALVIFNTKAKDDGGQERWVKAVQWMPMVYGIIKKMRNSGELASIVAHEVYQRDHFKYRLGDDESVEHEPYMGPEEPGPMIAVYAIAKLKDGTIQREVMTRAQVDKVRNASRSKDRGPWVSWYEEMARKTVVRRLSKYLPMSTEIEDMLRRDDALSVSGRAPDDRPAVLTIDGEIDETDLSADASQPEMAGEIIEGETDRGPEKPKSEAPNRASRSTRQTAARNEPPAQEEPPPFDPETGEIEQRQGSAAPETGAGPQEEDLF